MQLLALGQTELQLHPALFIEIELGRDQRLPLTANRAEEPIDLAAMEQQLARAARLVIEPVRRPIFRNIGVDQNNLAALGGGIGLSNIGPPLAQGLNLGSGQHHPRLKTVFEEIVKLGAPVLGNQLMQGHDQISPASRMASRIAGFTSSLHGAIGKRTSASHRPRCDRANLVGEGDASRNSALCRRTRRSC